MNPKSHIKIILWILVFVFPAFVLFDFLRSGDFSRTPEAVFDLEEKELVVFLEAVSRIRENGLFLDPDTPQSRIFQDSLKAYLSRNDPFSDYLTREEFVGFKQLRDEQYIGIGMEIGKDPQGRIICFPYPESPAEREGIRAGDYLEKINDIPVDGKSIFTVASMARDCKGTPINIVIRSGTGYKKEVSVPCENLQVEYIKNQLLHEFTVIQIHAFFRSTALKLENILSAWQKKNPVIIDLRGNWGGDLQAAIDSAELFLEENQMIAEIETRAGTKRYKSKSVALDLEYPVYLWQDGTTASAAEVFIAALTGNHKAVSIGRPTYGKGTTQDIVELGDGSALILTTGRLITPNGIGYQGRGLKPMHLLNKDSSDTNDYLSKVRELRRTSFKPADGSSSH